MKLEELKVHGETIYSGKILTVQKDVVILPNGKKTYREIVKHSGACCVAAIDKEENLLMVRQFRYAVNRELLELPAGKLDVEGELPLDAAKRELFEETGFKAKKWGNLGTICPSPGYCNEIIYLYVATDLIKAGNLHLDSDEFLKVEKYTLTEMLKKIQGGEITDSKTICTVLKLKMLLDERKIEI